MPFFIWSFLHTRLMSIIPCLPRNDVGFYDMNNLQDLIWQKNTIIYRITQALILRTMVLHIEILCTVLQYAVLELLVETFAVLQ